jgi:hypothetical protein
MNNNFVLIDTSFGKGSGGCSICAANIKRFWCWYVKKYVQKDYNNIIHKGTHVLLIKVSLWKQAI